MNSTRPDIYDLPDIDGFGTHFILKNGEIVPVPLMEWAMWMENDQTERIIAQDKIKGVFISTVFLGLDHSFYNATVPILFETMISGGQWDSNIVRRYETLADAKRGHRAAKRLVYQNVNWLTPIRTFFLKRRNARLRKRVEKRYGR